MVYAVWQDDNTKALIDIITEVFLEDMRAGAKPSSEPFFSVLGQGRTSRYWNQRQRPAMPLQRLRYR